MKNILWFICFSYLVVLSILILQFLSVFQQNNQNKVDLDTPSPPPSPPRTHKAPQDFQTFSVRNTNGYLQTTFDTLFSLHEINYSPTVLSHQMSQHREDNFAFDHFFQHQITHRNLSGGGTFIELGALNGLTFSNTHAYEKTFNWRGVLIEADPTSFNGLKQNRPIQSLVLSAVCSTPSIVDYVTTSDPAVRGILQFMSPGFKKTWHQSYKSQKIACIPLEMILQLTSRNRHFDFFSLDVEGGELEVLKTLDWDTRSFSVIVIEADRTNPQKEVEIISLLKSKGYVYYGHQVTNDWFFHPKYIQPVPAA